MTRFVEVIKTAANNPVNKKDNEQAIQAIGLVLQSSDPSFSEFISELVRELFQDESIPPPLVKYLFQNCKSSMELGSNLIHNFYAFESFIALYNLVEWQGDRLKQSSEPLTSLQEILMESVYNPNATDPVQSFLDRVESGAFGNNPFADFSSEMEDPEYFIPLHDDLNFLKYFFHFPQKQSLVDDYLLFVDTPKYLQPPDLRRPVSATVIFDKIAEAKHAILAALAVLGRVISQFNSLPGINLTEIPEVSFEMINDSHLLTYKYLELLLKQQQSLCLELSPNFQAFLRRKLVKVNLASLNVFKEHTELWNKHIHDVKNESSGATLPENISKAQFLKCLYQEYHPKPANRYSISTLEEYFYEKVKNNVWTIVTPDGFQTSDPTIEPAALESLKKLSITNELLEFYLRYIVRHHVSQPECFSKTRHHLMAFYLPHAKVTPANIVWLLRLKEN